jgi:hypothetical protein
MVARVAVAAAWNARTDGQNKQLSAMKKGSKSEWKKMLKFCRSCRASCLFEPCGARGGFFFEPVETHEA